MDIRFELLDEALWFIISGGAGFVASWILSHFAKHGVQWWVKMDDAYRRYLALALSGILGIAAYLAMVVMLIQPQPEDWRGWVRSLVAVAFTAMGVSQIRHAEVKRRNKKGT